MSPMQAFEKGLCTICKITPFRSGVVCDGCRILVSSLP